ncbi:hypothetical protein SOVF_213070 [Spinacia oleracea]|nr:hypothetical protein SOVF_213070 [Spinacia oleracea]
MGAFELGKLHKYLIRCLDTEAIWVYELSISFENMDAFEEKDWTRCEGPIGPGHDYNSLKVGDQEIKGSELKKLMKLLCFSRLAVNLEGYCFLDTIGLATDNNNTDEFQLQYQMIRRSFDWSSFQLIKSSPVDNKDDNTEELSILENRVSDLEKELEERVFEKSGQSGEDFFYDVVCRSRVLFPSDKFAVGSAEAKTEFTRARVKRGEKMVIDEILTPMDTKPNTLPLPVIPVQVSKGEFDREKWWVMTVATRKINGWETDLRRIIYYDHEVKRRRQLIGDRTIAVPFLVGSEFRFKAGCGLHMIHGVGVRFVFFL